MMVWLGATGLLLLGGALALRNAPLPSGLAASAEAGRVRIFWDLTGPVRNAAAAEIIIRDGGKRTNIALSNRQLQAGSMLYAPSSDAISVEMVWRAADGATNRETAHVRGAQAVERAVFGN